MEILFLLGGVVLGAIITQIINLHKAGYGSFRLDPIDDPELTDEYYTVSIGLKPDQQLLNKKRIILTRDDSPK